ncbi:MAG: hypothetical protein HY056_17335 [Proteobacteria bacterium]|nr:hypothetical protein [Pseudomonadota bacterium]
MLIISNHRPLRLRRRRHLKAVALARLDNFMRRQATVLAARMLPVAISAAR